MQIQSRNQPTLHDWTTALRSTAARAGDSAAGAHKVGPTGFLQLMGAPICNRSSCNGIDESLWNAAIDPSITETTIVTQLEQAGPLHDQADSQAIELWTERELSALHALWTLARLRGQSPWRIRALDAARWHLEHTQPDNATNHPWAIHVFLVCWNDQPGSETGITARLYAETMLHNCQTQLAKPDPLSALILRSAADELDFVFRSG